ncbi:MAG: hypothetical protein QW796_04065 [Thermoproteota archaeon]
MAVGVVRVKCSRCGRFGSLVRRKVGSKGKTYLAEYVGHYEGGRVKWCYIGIIHADQPGRARPPAATLKSPASGSVAGSAGLQRDGGLPEADEAKALLRVARGLVDREYSDEELMRALVKEAKCDCFQNVGRVFLNDFCRWYNCTPERVISILGKSGLKWRYDPGSQIVLINFQERVALGEA